MPMSGTTRSKFSVPGDKIRVKPAEVSSIIIIINIIIITIIIIVIVTSLALLNENHQLDVRDLMMLFEIEVFSLTLI